MLDLDQSIIERHSTRMFLPRPGRKIGGTVARLALAQHAPSNSNIQPWRLVFASGTARNRLIAPAPSSTRGIVKFAEEAKNS